MKISGVMLAQSGVVADPRWSPSGEQLAWVETRRGRTDLVVRTGDGAPVVVTAECGIGAGYAWASEEELVVAAADGRLLVVHPDGGVARPLTRDGRAQTPAVSARGQVAFVLERDDSCDIAIVPLDGSEWPVRASHADYAWDPAWSPDGTRLVWHEWDLPDMSWDSSRIVVREGDAAKVVAGGDGIAVGQPRFSPVDNDLLAYVSDAEGFAQLWIARADGSEARPVLREPREHAESAWGKGARSYAWSPDGEELVWCRNEDGFGRLVIAAPGARSARDLSKGWHRGLDWGERGIACVRSGAVTPGQIVVLAANGSARQSIARGPVGGFERTGLVEPRAVTWKSGAANVHGLLYRPAVRTQRSHGRRSEGAINEVERPPLLVHLHGGPTSQAIADFSPRVQWFVQRGFAVLSPNYRGSSGYGRQYAQALAQHWGERDVADVIAGIKHAVKEEWCDPDRVALMGGSAGGYTALLVAAREPTLVHRVITLFPVTDLLDLAATTHRFESGYHLRLVGSLPETRDRYRERSPVTVAGQIQAPVLLMHGSDDDNVPVQQSTALADALRAAGTTVDLVVYDGEGHGWRKPDTILDEITRIEAFLREWL